MPYYADKKASLGEIFGAKDITVGEDFIVVDGRRYPVVDDVIVLLDPARYPPSLRRRTARGDNGTDAEAEDFSTEVQLSFGEEWRSFSNILAEHQDEFGQYFDLVDTTSLANARVCDLGCGIGRWSYYLTGKCREIVAVDFSDAIFVARRNLRHADNTLFFMADLRRLPFGADFCDFLFCIGVLHHLPTDCLDEVRKLAKFAPRLLIYLYYALDNRPWYFRLLFRIADSLRRAVSGVRDRRFRAAFTVILAIIGYYPFIALGGLLAPFKLARWVPLWEFYRHKSFERVRQDVYDRFFTPIEQRVSRAQIIGLGDSFSRVSVSEGIPLWHFLCER